MAFFFGDGFDLYTAFNDCASYWDTTLGSAGGFALSTTGRFSGSRGLVITSGGSNIIPHLTKTSNVNDAVHHIILVAQQTSAFFGTNIGFYATLFDGATAQCSVGFRSDGALVLTSGSLGTTLATYIGALGTINTWYAFEIEVVINNTTGSIAVRRNGNTNNDFFLGSLNTRPGANAYANKIGIGNFWGAGAGSQLIDDFLWRSDASSVPWIGDVRCFTRMPATDNTAQWTRSGPTPPITPFAGGGNIGPQVDNSWNQSFISPYDGTIGSVSMSMVGAATANFKCAIFADNGSGRPGVVLGTATPISNPIVGNNIFTFGTPVAVTHGVQYWVGFISSAASGLWNSTTGAVNGMRTNSPAYASWPASNPSIAITNVQAIVFTVFVTTTPSANANFVCELQQDGAISYVYSSTNGQADLYTIGSIGSTPAIVVGVTTRGYFQKSTSGTRNATVQLKSGATTVQGASTTLSNGVWGWIARNDLVDPATGVAWTAAGVNNALIGPVVTA